MIKETSQFLLSNIDDIKNKTLAVAYSGGIDSQVMLNIAYRLKDELSFNLIIIHVNYNLRGEDSINDELFARDMAKKYNIDIYVKEIPPNSYIGKNIQLEARNDRYAFFEELYNKKIYDYLLMAHNKDDLVETIIYRMIKGAGTDVIRIRGVEKLHGTSYSIIPDQIEAGTFMCAAAATMGDVMVKNVIPKHLEATTAKLEEIGCQVEEFDDAVRVVANKRLKRTNVKTMPYPGYPTDMQPQFAVALTLAEGTSIITESIFENRFKYVAELVRMGADIKVEGNTAIVNGVEKLTGAQVSAPDLRAGAALVIAGLAAEGITIVDDIVYIQRGYERFEEKLRGLGAEIEKVTSEKEIKKFQLRVG